MNGGALYSIGDLSRRTGLTVKAIRFYSDQGIVPPTVRSSGGYRRYDAEAAARLDLVRTLRELGLDLATIRRIVEREIPLSEVAAAHAQALTVQIRVLRLRRAVLMAVAKRGSTAEEAEMMHALARQSEDERRRLIGEFLDAVFGGLDPHPALVGIMRSMTPQLADDAEEEQIEAWVEWAELSQDADFRASMRRMAQHFAADRAPSGAGMHPDPVAVVRDRARPAVRAGIDPTSSHADRVVTAVTADYAHRCRRRDDVALRRRLLVRLDTARDPRRDRYMRLLSVINGWSAPDEATVELDWFTRALRARTLA